MRVLPIFQVDAFASEVFQGNPAAVCPLTEWLPDDVLQAIAEENNLAETAFFVPTDDDYRLRWFTPRCEVPLCGHATLAAAFVLFTATDASARTVTFQTASGALHVSRYEGMLRLDLPAVTAALYDAPTALLGGLGLEPCEVLRAESDPNYIVVLESEQAVARLDPNLACWERLHPYGVVVTALGSEVDFVSRYFAPSYGIPEDSVTGSTHCALAPYWAGRLGRDRLRARQLSRRGGELICEVAGSRVAIIGTAKLYLKGEIHLPAN